ncbi:caspase family protein [Metabacillus fastidiosus]|uniref:caspase family protein n=1 Tax=Metabacillus fastidiosus TaxID=1458 RepID=UPI002E21BE40|nr:caspase family protein [Metabacillus fastidiosus]MED4532928.1 caspase family protein [Metabacillus fastidiosus]
MKLAIIIGVSEYENLSDLKACDHDVILMKNLINQVSKYDEVLVINGELNSQETKDKIINFVQKYRKLISDENKKVSELFFYFTGHGYYDNNEFYFLLSDFHDSHLNKTSLQNSELDNFFRALAPELMIKVVDACQSGVKYIKTDIEDSMKKTLDLSGDSYNKCYFMYSSKLNQSSFADDNFSFFTRSFIDSITSYEGYSIRYKDIIDYIADDFKDNDSQQPLYIVQAEFTETFAEIQPELKNRLLSLISQVNENLAENALKTNESNGESLVDLIKKDAERYCSDIEVIKELLNKIYGYAEGFNLDSFTDFYNVTVKKFNGYRNLPKIDVIASHMDQDQEGYFVDIEREKQEETGLISSWVKSYRDVPINFTINVGDLPYKTISINAEEKYPNLDRYNCTIIYVFSRVTIKFFYFYTKYDLRSWDNYELNSHFKWLQITKGLLQEKDVLDTVNYILQGFKKYVEEETNNKINLIKGEFEAKA